MSTVVVIGAYAKSVVNFRGDLIRAFLARGHSVVAMAGAEGGAGGSTVRAGKVEAGEIRERVEELGASYRSYPVQRNGMNPFRDVRTLFALRKVFHELKPDVVIAYTIKPVIWGGLAFRSRKRDAKFYALITGLGLAFQPGGFKQSILTRLVTFLYRSALAGAAKVIFQNEENCNVFVDRNIVHRDKTMLVNGSGVNLDKFSLLPFPHSNLTFLTIARLLGDKGLRELERASSVIKSECESVTINLVGPADPSPDGIPLSDVQRWNDSGTLNYLGESSDVRPHIAACHVYVLPSYHEGMPRTVLEAMAAGRPIITTDVPGCRETVPLTDKGRLQRDRGETVMEGENGYLVCVKDPVALAEAMQHFIDNPELIRAMGKRSREIAEEKYDVHKVNAVMLEAIEL